MFVAFEGCVGEEHVRCRMPVGPFLLEIWFFAGVERVTFSFHVLHSSHASHYGTRPWHSRVQRAKRYPREPEYFRLCSERASDSIKCCLPVDSTVFSEGDGTRAQNKMRGLLSRFSVEGERRNSSLVTGEGSRV